MAKEVVAGETVGTIDDDGPEEGEIEDDTSEEDGAEKKVCSSNSTDVNTSVGINYYQPSSSSKSESHNVKSKVYSEGKKHVWGNSRRRIPNFYVDHDKPSRESYSRLTKSDINSDHRELNFHDLLKDYRTSKHGNEGDSHEKENRHFTKGGRSDSTRKREDGMSELQEEELKRSRKRKQHRSQSRDRNTSMSSDTDGVRKRKDVRITRQKRNRKIPPLLRNLRGSAALFAQIRASKLKASSVSGQQKTVDEVVPDDMEITAEVKELHSLARDPTSQSIEGSCKEAGECIIEAQLPDKGPYKNEASKSLCSASDSQTADRNEDSESKDEEDDVNQLRMIALQSAFRAKYLERKRRGIIVRKQGRRTSLQIPPKEGNVDSAFNLDDTADLLEAAVEDAVSLSASKETPPIAKVENWQTASLSSLSEVPLPPDDPPVPSPVEDLTPVDMELALTDEEENASMCENVENDKESESVELYHTRVRTSRCLPKARSIPVTIGGRTPACKLRKRTTTHTNDKTRSNLLEVRTCISGDQETEDHDSTVGGMVGVNMNSMILLDAVGTCSSPEVDPSMDDEHTLSEASDTKSDLVPYSSNQACFSGNVADDEDEELLRARLLVEISRRHRGMNMASSAIMMKEMKGNDADIANPPVHETVVANAAQERELVMRPKIKSFGSISANLQSGRVKLPSKRSVERTRRGQLLARVLNRQVSIPSNTHVSLSPYVKSYLSKITSRGKYQRVNQSRMIGGKKRIDGNLHVTVMGSGSVAKSVSTVPQQQDRIVICLGEDSDESDDERPKTISKRFPQGNNLPLPSEKSLANQVGMSESLAVSDVIGSSQKPVLDSQFPNANVSADFEKSVDRFLKEVRSVQESRLQDCPPLDVRSTGEKVVQKRAVIPLGKVNIKANVTAPGSRVISKTNIASAVPNVTLKANSSPATSKVVGNTAKAKPGKQITKAVSGVTPQAVRHLPPPQQEEYRRLKMQISVLEELHKKRKAAKILHASLGGEKTTQGKECGSVLSTGAPKFVSQVHQPKESNPIGDSSDKVDADVSLDLMKTIRPQAPATNNNVLLSSDDIEEEDVNLMREQLLRSRLQKKMNALSETLAEKSETSLSSKEAIPIGPDVVLNSMSVTPKLSRVVCNSTSEELVIKSSTVNAIDNFQRKIPTLSKGIVTSSDRATEIASGAHEEGWATASHPEGSPSKGLTGTSARGDAVEGGMPEGYADPSMSNISPAVPTCSPAVENASLRNSGSLSSVTKMEEEAKVVAVSQEVGGDKCAKVSIEQTEGNSEVKTAATQASLDPSTSMGVASTQFPLENSDSRASELAELEFQLLSERHAALQYLSELSSLLTKMEIEGAHLRQKEIAAQKLRAELACAESAIVVQKDYLKQLALTISSTHERVTSTRQRCSMLCHACTRLGNQLKQDKRVNGGKGSAYQVPTGGAALVKSQLSSVLWQTKQLKKAGLPFLRGQNFVASAKCPPTKKPPRGGDVGALPRTSNVSILSLESLTISSSSKSSPPPEEPSPGSSKTSSNCENSILLTKSSVVLGATSKLNIPINSGVCVSDASREISPAPTNVLHPEKFALDISSCAVASNSVKSATEPSIRSENEVAVGTRPVSKGPLVVEASPSQAAESEVCKAAVGSNPAASEVVSSSLGGQKPEKGVQLKDYQSPLEPITNRINAETLTLSSRSSQQDASMPLDPNVILCPYDLMGECQDEECKYQHQRGKAMVKGS